MRIVVTGAMGHIGSSVIRDLPRQFAGAEIVMVDNLLTQRFPSLFNLPAEAKFRFIQGDVASLDLRKTFENADVVIHLAAITDAAGSFDRAEELEANNYNGTANVSKSCVETGVRLIAVSTTSVYGTQNKVVAEDCSPDELKPQSPYATTKLKEEELVLNLCAQDGLRAIVFRFGTIYGVSPGMRFHTAVNKFCWQAVMGQPLTVWKSAFEQKRPYLDLRDASRAIAFAIRQDLFDDRIYNVLTNNSTVREIVELIREYVPKLKVEFVETQIMNQFSYEVSCARFMDKGFEFGGALRDGISATIDRLRQSNSLAGGPQ